MHHCIHELEHNFDQVRQAVLHAHERVGNRIANTAACYAPCSLLYALVPLAAALADAGLSFIGGYEVVLSWVHVPAAAAFLDALLSLALGASLVIMCWLSDLCRESGSAFRRWSFAAFSCAPMLFIGAPVLYHVFSWARTHGWLELDRLLKIGAIALIAAIAHSLLFFEADTCMDALQKWQLGRDKKALVSQVVRLRDAARALVSAWNTVRIQAEQQNEESGAHGCPTRLRNPIFSESLPDSLDLARTLLASQDLIEVLQQIRNPVRNQRDQFETSKLPL